MSGSKTGGCLCGAARFELSEAPTEYGACHCGICRKFSGGIEMGVHVPPGGITWTRADSVRAYTSSEWAERGFCSACGSSLFWRLTAPGPMQGMLSLSVGALDDMKGMKFTTEVYVDAKPKSHSFAGKRKKMTEAEVLQSVGMSDG
ncbi:MAG: GFA family protein [Sulfitobacter sp.]